MRGQINRGFKDCRDITADCVTDVQIAAVAKKCSGKLRRKRSLLPRFLLWRSCTRSPFLSDEWQGNVKCCSVFSQVEHFKDAIVFLGDDLVCDR